jgi:hypothetical protein
MNYARMSFAPKNLRVPPVVDSDTFVSMFFRGKAEPTLEQLEAIEMFCEALQSVLWTSGRQGGKSTIRGMIRGFLEWAEEWERRGGMPRDLISTAPLGHYGDPMPGHATRDDVLEELWRRAERLERPQQIYTYVPAVYGDNYFNRKRRDTHIDFDGVPDFVGKTFTMQMPSAKFIEMSDDEHRRGPCMVKIPYEPGEDPERRCGHTRVWGSRDGGRTKFWRCSDGHETPR